MYKRSVRSWNVAYETLSVVIVVVRDGPNDDLEGQVELYAA